MSVAETIKHKLVSALNPEYLDVVNESSQHGGPATDSHFKLTVVSNDFASLRPVSRHQKVYALLSEELDGGVHALAMHLYTQQEWAQQKVSPESPKCLGGT